jgi:hypothetical protein
MNKYNTKKIHKRRPQGSCYGPDFSNVMYNLLLNLKFNSRTKVIAFADDLTVLTRGACKMQKENYANQYLKQIERWDTDNKIEFDKKILGFIYIKGKKRQRS